MKSNIQCGLKGQYKVDIFSGNKLVETTDWFSNDITNTGVLYPFIYPFARCFMFLSLGHGQFTTQVDGLQSYTGFESGASAITGFTTDDGNTQTGTYMGWPFYASGSVGSSACGTQFTPSGVNFFRAWNIPTGNVAIGGTGLQIDSFMVSPSSGSDPTGKYAFSCVNQSVSIASGYNATIYYMLSLNFNDYARAFVYFPTGASGNGYFNTGNANIGGIDTTLVSGWANISGIYRQLFPGLQCVDNNGACVVSDHGAMLEPNMVNASNLYFYLSPDISNYAVSKYDGTGLLTESGAYNSYGLSANYSEYSSYISLSNPTAAITNVSNTVTITDPNTFYYSGDANPSSSVAQSYLNPPVLTQTNKNIHLSNLPNLSGYSGILSSSSFKYNQTNFVNATGQPIAYASPGGSLFSSVIPNYGQPAVFSTSLRRVPPTIVTGRTQKSTKSSRISPIQSLGWNARYGSLVLANINGLTSLETVQAFPYMEYLFFDNSGRGANMPHYRIIPEIYMVDRGTGVSQVVFSITGQGIDGSPSSPIQRIWSATGFMGPYSGTSSGLNPNYPWTGLFTGTGPSFGNPPLQSGIVFSGNNPSSNLTGTFSGLYGNGAVYGIIAPNSGFYGLPYDTCLLDNPVWSGFSGDLGFGSLPNPTGETGLLCWPSQGSKIGLSITGMQYSGAWSGTNVVCSFSDFSDILVGTSGYQFISDILFSGNSIINTLSGSGVITFSDGTHTTQMNFLSGSSKLVTGYNFNSTFTRGSGQSFARAIILAMTGNALVSGNLSGTAGAISIPNGALSLLPTNFKKPIGRIHHLEYFTGSGYRLLPNYASGNNNFTGLDGNTYSPVLGGAFPGLSSQNGMQIYFDFIWSA